MASQQRYSGSAHCSLPHFQEIHICMPYSDLYVDRRTAEVLALFCEPDPQKEQLDMDPPWRPLNTHSRFLCYLTQQPVVGFVVVSPGGLPIRGSSLTQPGEKTHTGLYIALTDEN